MIFTENDFLNEVRENMRGGEGSAHLTFLLPGKDVTNLRLFSLITLDKGCSIGEHVHEGEAEVFYALCGSGTVVDDGTPRLLNQGDCHLCESGHTHALKNENDEPFVVLAAIITE